MEEFFWLNCNLEKYPPFKVGYNSNAYFETQNNVLNFAVWHIYFVCFDVKKYTKLKIGYCSPNAQYSAQIISTSTINDGNDTGILIKSIANAEYNVEIDISSVDYVSFIATNYSGGGGVFTDVIFE